MANYRDKLDTYSSKIKQITITDPYDYYNITYNKNTPCVICGEVYTNKSTKSCHERRCLLNKMRNEIDELLEKMQELLFEQARLEMSKN